MDVPVVNTYIAFYDGKLLYKSPENCLLLKLLLGMRALHIRVVTTMQAHKVYVYLPNAHTYR